MCVCVRLCFKVIKCTPFLITANTWNYLSDTSLLPHTPTTASLTFRWICKCVLCVKEKKI